jgi:clathrin heavy chain
MSWLSFGIDLLPKAEDPSNLAEVIEIASHAGKHDNLVCHLQMARKLLREPRIGTELAYAYAKTDRLHDMGGFPGNDQCCGCPGGWREML